MKIRTIFFALAGIAVVSVLGWLALNESARLAPAANRAVPGLVSLSSTDKAGLSGGGVAGSSSSGAATGAAAQAVGVRKLFEATWPDVKGGGVPMRSFLGKPLVVNFWATWCAPCLEEMPHLDELARSLVEVQFVGLGIDTQANIERFLAGVPVAYPVLVAGNSAIANVRELGNAAGGLPFTVLINAKGELVETLLGQQSLENLRNKIKALALK
jgi:thiol-disulfide isomerase/thioredoxin